MKKFLSILLASLMVLSLFACQKQAKVEETKPVETTKAQTTAAPETTAAAETTTVAPETTAEQVAKINLVIIKDRDDSMKNTYTIMAVNPNAPFVDADGNKITDVKINTAGADAFIKFMLSEGADMASKFGKEEYGDNLFFLIDGRPTFEGEIPKATEETKLVRLSSTTSMKDTGLFDLVLPVFEEKYGYKVEYVSVGTGKAIANAKAGNADVVLVHAKAQEEKFVEEGFTRVVEGYNSPRLSFMYNFFLLVGPEEDPAKAKEAPTVQESFKRIADGKHLFVSRGDNSGTHSKELTLWPKELGITTDPASFEPYKDWYISANAGMGACLLMANEKKAYILTDIATFLSFRANGGQIKH